MSDPSAAGLFRFHLYEQGRLAALRGESLDSLPDVPKPWLHGWRAGTRQRLYREACVDPPIQQLIDLQAFGWTLNDMGRALHVSGSTVYTYLRGKQCVPPRVAERIKTLHREVNKAEEWLSAMQFIPAEALPSDGPIETWDRRGPATPSRGSASG